MLNFINISIMAPNNQDNKQASPINRTHSMDELNMKYEPSSDKTKMITEEKSPKKAKKSKVKQMASMFNKKISQIIKRDVRGYINLVNELSPEPILPTPKFFKPAPLPRRRVNKPPVPNPRTATFAKVEVNSSGCFVPEDIFAKLSVKDKAKLYMQFVEEMTKKNPKFGPIESKNRLIFKPGEIVIEKQATVKDLLEELEFNSIFPKSNVKRTSAIQRMDSMKKACAARKNLQGRQFENSAKKATTTIQQLEQKPKMKKQSSATDNKQNQLNGSMFQNQQIEDLFFSWFKEKHESVNGNVSVCDEEKDKSTIDTLLNETIAELETIEAEENAKIPQTNLTEKSPTTSSAKPSETEESESGVSSLPKSASEESQPENQVTKIDNPEISFEFAKPVKPLRKKKMRKNSGNKKEVAQQEARPMISTDSEPDNKQDENRPSEPYDNLEELDQSLMKLMNSPRKIKSAYTLTINDLETPVCTPRTSLNFAKQAPARRASLNRLSLSDHRFETATNDAHSPRRRASSIKTKAEQTTSPLPSTVNSSADQFGYSTPNQSQEQHSFAATSSAKRIFSPIFKPIKNRRKSFYDIESQRNSLVNQVIKEDQPFEPQETRSSNIFSPKEQNSFANTADQENPKITHTPPGKSSQFWIICGDFSLILDIDYIGSERLRLLYEIFSQTSCDTKDLYFGIDNYKFSIHDPLDLNTSTRIPAAKGCSHYWFSTGDLAIPFSGKYLTSQKIQRLFRVIKETVEESGVLRFGVDAVEFSNAPEFWHQAAKFSMESQYSMLVGLQTGDSNGLEGRSKYCWPHSRSVMISDLDQSDNVFDKYKDIESSRLSCSTIGSNYYDWATLDNEELSMPRNSVAMANLDAYCCKYESEPLDQLFDGGHTQKQQNDLKPKKTMTVPEMIHTVRNEKQRLSAVQTQLSNCVKPSFITRDALDACKGTPEYVETLKRIISDINKIGCNNYLKECSIDELDSYMYFLSRYAEVCLSSCGKHIEKVLDALGGSNEILV